MKKFTLIHESTKNNIEPWDMDLMNLLLDKYEEQYGSLDDVPWEEIQVIKKALWIGYSSCSKGMSVPYNPIH